MSTKFEDFELIAPLQKAVADMGYEEMTPIQEQTIPIILSGEDVVGQAQTGTGKTAAFGLPVCQLVDTKSKDLQALVLCPTRELAIQVAEEFHKFAKYMHALKILPIYGGQDIVRQIRALQGGVQIVIGTPGRVMDHMRRGKISLEHLRVAVLDEADEMLDMGFREDMETILENASGERQTLLFSATMPDPILQLSKKFQHHAQFIKVVKKELTVPQVEQYYYEVKPKTKIDVLARLLDLYNPKLSLIFCNTKRMVDELVIALQSRNYFVEGIHGDLSQTQRDRVMKSFKSGRTDILIATDVAARGLDVDNVEVVFNYDLPQDEEYYVHRIGRTGRAGKPGKALSLVVGKEVYRLRDIQRYANTKITLRPIPSINDVTAVKADSVFDRLSKIIAEDDLSRFIDIIDSKVNNEEYSSLDVAAGLLKLYMGDSFVEIEEPIRHESVYVDSYSASGSTGEGMVRLFLNTGRSSGVRPGDIVGAIAGETGLSGKLIGTIKMYDNYAFVEVPAEASDEVMQRMKNVKIRGKAVNMEKASDRKKG